MERGPNDVDSYGNGDDAKYGLDNTVTSGLDGMSWHEAYRILRDKFYLPGEDAYETVMRLDRGELATRDPADIGALD